MFETIRRQFLVEVTGDGNPGRHHVTSLAEVNQLLDHWVHKACHQQVHSETGQDSRQRWEAAAPADLQAVGRLREALAWTVPATEPPQNPHRTRTLISPVARCRRRSSLAMGTPRHRCGGMGLRTHRTIQGAVRAKWSARCFASGLCGCCHSGQGGAGLP